MDKFLLQVLYTGKSFHHHCLSGWCVLDTNLVHHLRFSWTLLILIVSTLPVLVTVQYTHFWIWWDITYRAWDPDFWAVVISKWHKPKKRVGKINSLHFSPMDYFKVRFLLVVLMRKPTDWGACSIFLKLIVNVIQCDDVLHWFVFSLASLPFFPKLIVLLLFFLLSLPDD